MLSNIFFVDYVLIIVVARPYRNVPCLMRPILMCIEALLRYAWILVLVCKFEYDALMISAAHVMPRMNTTELRWLNHSSASIFGSHPQQKTQTEQNIAA